MVDVFKAPKEGLKNLEVGSEPMFTSMLTMFG